MTINTWQNAILSICKYCKNISGRNRNGYQCDRFNCSIYDANNCRRTASVRNQVVDEGDEHGQIASIPA